MERDVLLALFNNAALLLVLSVIYEAANLLPSRYYRFQSVFSGIMIALICAVVMSMPLTLRSGIIFDTRTILISMTALIFGPIATAITVVVAAIVRLSIGGVGTLAGLATIMTSALIGLAWRRWVYPKSKKWRWLNIFAMSVCVHGIMLACMLLLPSPDNLNVIRAIALPVMLIYPIATVLLNSLLMRQQSLRRTQDLLKQSEERFKLLFEKAPLGYQSLDFDGYFIDVNNQWCDLLGYSRGEVIGKWFGDFLSPAYREAFCQRFPIFKAQGYIHSEFEMLNKIGKPLFVAFEGRIGYGFDGQFKQTHCILQDITNQKAAEAALIESENKYRNITENMSDVVWQADLNLKTTYVSPSVEKLLGESTEEHMKRRLEEKFPEQTLKKVHSLLYEEIEREKDPKTNKNRSRTIEVEHFKADGTIVWIEMNLSFIRDTKGNIVGFQGVSRDITQRKLAELALEESERSKSVLLSNLPGMAYRCNYDREWTMQFVSAGSVELTGYTPESLINNKDLSYNDLISPEYHDLLWIKWEQFLSKKLPFEYEYEIITAAGERKWVLEMGQGIYYDNGEVEALEGIILDISDRKQMEDNLRYINEHDGRTGLYNRGYLELLLIKDFKKRDELKRAVISINLSTIQLLTANYGFHYTQNLIKKAADTLIQYCTDNCLLFQTYENQFVFYLIDYKDKNELVDFGNAIAETLESLLVTDRIGGGIGILEIEQEDKEANIDLLLRRLLIASERAITVFDKDFGACFYNEELEALVTREVDIRQALSAIATDQETNDELFLQYQPIMDLKTESICGFEALARLRTQKLGLVSPVEFIPTAEKTKLILPIGEKVIIQAFCFLNRLKEYGFEKIGVSINISAIQLLRPDFTSRLFEMISEMQINPKNIGLEITESVFASAYEDINSIIGKLKNVGIQIAIDDFGTGYSSLAREKELSVNCLKIDKYFMDKLMDGDIDKAITGDIISMAHRLGHCAVAEGVEHKRQLLYLREHDCDKIQGYLISKPLDEEAALEFLKKQENISDFRLNDSQY